MIYDDLTLPQWVVGQLSNIYHMKDQNTARHALLQVILAMKHATSLPWTAVRGAWATSMHDLEEGTLGWKDTTQWSINRLSASQISMSGTQASQAKKVCRFFTLFCEMREFALTSPTMGTTNMCVIFVTNKEKQLHILN